MTLDLIKNPGIKCRKLWKRALQLCPCRYRAATWVMAAALGFSVRALKKMTTSSIWTSPATNLGMIKVYRSLKQSKASQRGETTSSGLRDWGAPMQRTLTSTIIIPIITLRAVEERMITGTEREKMTTTTSSTSKSRMYHNPNPIWDQTQNQSLALSVRKRQRTITTWVPSSSGD